MVVVVVVVAVASAGAVREFTPGLPVGTAFGN